MDLPPELYLNGTIEQGAVYYFPEEKLTSEEPHYFVVMNADPKQNVVLLMTCATSKVQKTINRRNDELETIVVVASTECEFFKKMTAFDCNIIFEKRMEQLVQKYNEGKLKYKGLLPKAIIEKLRKGIQMSKEVTTIQKKLI